MNKDVHNLGKASHRHGYTLYEVLMTLGLATTILALGVPSFGNVAANQRLATDINALFHAIHLARKGSVVRRRVVSICPSLDQETCGSRQDWSAGWIVFVNIDRDSPAVRDQNEPILRRYKVQTSTKVIANRRSFSLRSTDLRATNGSVIFCDRMQRGTPRALVVSYTGRPRVAYKDRYDKPYRCSH